MEPYSGNTLIAFQLLELSSEISQTKPKEQYHHHTLLPP